MTADCARAAGLSHPHSPKETAVMVISHDCDLAQNAEIEPHCEVIVGRLVAEQDGNFANAKSPRRLHLKLITDGSEEVIVELEATAKAFVSKDDLALHLPEQKLVLAYSEATKLRSWLAARYRRASFPDEFDRRLIREKRKFYEKLLKILKESSDDIMAVYFDVDEGADLTRNGPNDPYELFITLQYNEVVPVV